MKITFFGILFFMASILAVIRIFFHIRHDTIGLRSAIIWIALSIGIGFFALFPKLLDNAMRIAQMENRMFFILILAVFILFALVFNLASQLYKAERGIAKLVREISLLSHKVDAFDKTGE